MEPRILSDEEYAVLKKKLHQAHDKVIKITLHEKTAMRELMDKIVMRLLIGIKIDLNSLKLDTTTYIRQNLDVFFSDVVYWATLIDETTGTPQIVKVGLLIEHKSDMPSELALRLQALDYITAIMKKNYDKKTDTTIRVIPIIFNQFDKEWTPQPFRSLFPESSELISDLIPEFGYLIINLATLSDEIMDSLDKYGTLKAALLAMRYVKISNS
jgi:Putative transposase, YhgA-like